MPSVPGVVVKLGLGAISLALTLGLAACGGGSSKAAGEECVASSECAAGLVCDLNAEPSVCAGNLTVLPDAGEVADAPVAPVDAPLDTPDAPPGTPDARIDAAVVVPP